MIPPPSLTDRSLYLVVFDLTSADHARVEYWLKV